MATTASDISNLIDLKVALIADLISKITLTLAENKPTYNIDGQYVDRNTYLKYLTDMQETEVDCLKKLYELMNLIQPYQFQSATNVGYCNNWGY